MERHKRRTQAFALLQEMTQPRVIEPKAYTLPPADQDAPKAWHMPAERQHTDSDLGLR